MSILAAGQGAAKYLAPRVADFCGYQCAVIGTLAE